MYIRKLILTLFLLNVSLNHLISKEESFSEVLKSKINPNELEILVGLPFLSKVEHCFHIHDTNSKGEVVGEASFRNPNLPVGLIEKYAWYWHPENGFQIITTQTELFDSYAIERRATFQFYKLLINDLGVVAGSFLIDQVYNQAGRYNQCPWFWWSLEQGIHLSTLSEVYQLLKGVNENGFILLEETNGSNLKLTIKNIYHEGFLQTYAFNLSNELPSGFEKDIKELLFKSNAIDWGRDNGPVSVGYKWYPFIVDHFDDQLKISGHGSCKARLRKGIEIIFWDVNIGFEIENGRAHFFIINIVHERTIYNQLNNKIIYETTFNGSDI